MSRLVRGLAGAAIAITAALAMPCVAQADDAQAMRRLYNPNSGEHFYTASAGERANLIDLGWSGEGVGWVAPAWSSTPVFRLYNANGGDHHYTTSAGERDLLLSAGWQDEGIGWYSDDQMRVPLYRQYNPNARSGSHNYTASLQENNNLVRAGWNAEGIGWYGVEGASAQEPSNGEGQGAATYDAGLELLTFSHGEYGFNIAGINLVDGVTTTFDPSADAIKCNGAYVMYFRSDYFARSRISYYRNYDLHEYHYAPSSGGIVGLYRENDWHHTALGETGLSLRPVTFLGAEAASEAWRYGNDNGLSEIWRSKLCECCNLPEETDNDTINYAFCRLIAERFAEV